MSSPKFAAMTASLVRKGEAAPSPLGEMPRWTREMKPDIASIPRGPAPSAPPIPDPPPALPQRARKIVVVLSASQHDVLAIAAAKTGTSRQQIMRDALAGYLAGLAQGDGGACACLARGVLRAHARGL